MLCGIWDGLFWVPSVWLPLCSVLSGDICSFLLPGFVLSCFLIIVAVPRVARDVFCLLWCSPPAAARLYESGGRHFSKFTVFGFLLSTADAFVVPRHGSVHLELGDLFFLGLLLWIRTHYTLTVWCAGKWMTCAGSWTTAHPGWWGPVQGQSLTNCYLSHTPWTLLLFLLLLLLLL
jgi:hypothetical protein